MGGRAPGEALSRAQEGFLGGSRQSLRGGIELVQKLMCGNHPGPRRTVTRPGWGLQAAQRGSLAAGVERFQQEHGPNGKPGSLRVRKPPPGSPVLA